MTASEDIEQLIRGVKRRESGALRQMLSQYGPMVFAQVSGMVHPQEDAEEVYQDTFLKVFDNITSYRPERASLQTWIRQIAYRTALNHLRGHKPAVVYFDDEHIDWEELSDSQADDIFQTEDESTIHIIEQALEFLPPDEQAIITMFYYDELSLKEIAQITDSQPSTIGSKLCRIRKKLATIITQIKA